MSPKPGSSPSQTSNPARIEVGRECAGGRCDDATPAYTNQIYVQSFRLGCPFHGPLLNITHEWSYGHLIEATVRPLRSKIECPIFRLTKWLRAHPCGSKCNKTQESQRWEIHCFQTRSDGLCSPKKAGASTLSFRTVRQSGTPETLNPSKAGV